MFSSLRNYSRNIDQCQRFYYDNYDYYNIHEDIQQQYKDDLSKFAYNCTRRSTPVIINYGTEWRFKHSRLIKSAYNLKSDMENLDQNQEMDNHQQSMDISSSYKENNSSRHKTMEDFTNNFIKIYMENNYSIVSKNYQKQYLQLFTLLYFCPINQLKYQNCIHPQSNQKSYPFPCYLLTLFQLSSCIELLIQANNKKIQRLNQQYAQLSSEEGQAGRSNKLSFVQFQFGLELYSLKILSQFYNTDSQGLKLLFEFILELHRVMWEILNGRMRTVLLMAQPKTYYLNLIIHPLILPLTTFIKYPHQQIPSYIQKQYKRNHRLISVNSTSEDSPLNGIKNKPRIVFINLDGKQTSHNLRSISTLGQPLFYISLYNQPSWIQKRDVNMENMFNSEDQTFQGSYTKLWEIYSQTIMKQFKQVEGGSKAKVILFPLSSNYVNNKYMYQKFQENPNIDLSQLKSFKMPKIQCSKDIHSLFQHIILQQVRMFKPTMIFLSYNGQINILQEHFTDIVRNLSIIADHRIVLFTNFTHYFLDEPSPQRIQQQQQADKLLCIHQFYQKYFNFKMENINEQRLYGNISLFLKYGPGIYSMEDRLLGSPSMKYSMQRFYLYLQGLNKVEQLKFVQKYLIRSWNSEQLSSLYDQYRRRQIRQNKKENKYFQNLLSTVVNELLCINIQQKKLQDLLGKRLFYRFKYIEQELLQQHAQMKLNYNRFMKTDVLEQEQLGQEKQIGNKILSDYLENEKQKLLAQNLENYKIRKHFYLGESQKSFGQVSCYKFLLTNTNDGKEGQQIYLQKYSQIIVNQEQQQIFVINYKSVDNRHIMLYGTSKNSKIQKQINLYEIKQTDQQSSQEVKSYLQHMLLSQQGMKNQKQDIVFVQYNYCIFMKNLYLFWPLMWNLKQEARCKLLGVQYKPKRVWKMIRILPYFNQCTYKFQNLIYQPDQGSIQTLPRWGCSSYMLQQNNTFYIFGGIFDNQNDYKMIGSGVCVAQIKQNSSQNYKYFNIKTLPKSNFVNLKPKINYMIKKAQDKVDQYTYRISRGYGRDFTNYFNLFAYQQYEFDAKNIKINKLQVNPQNKIVRRIVNTQKPLESDRLGKFNVIMNNFNISQIQEKFSDSLKDKFLFQKKVQASNQNNQFQILTFIDENYRVNQFKTDPKKIFLFGFDRTVRQKIYLKCWSPELYIVDGIKQYIVNLSLKTQKTSSYLITNYLMPSQQNIISLCLQQDRIYLLSNSPIIHSIDRSGLKMILYEGSLTNINEVIRKRQIQMITKHSFQQKYEKFLIDKSIFVQDQKIYLVGGQCVQCDGMNGQRKFERQDYILETNNKNKFKMKTKKVQSSQVSLDMPNSVIIKQNEFYYLYSIVFQDSPNMEDQNQGIYLKLKIQKFTFENSELNKVKIGGFMTYAYFIQQTSQNRKQKKIKRYPHSNIDELKFVRILPYKRFSFAAVRQVISKIMWRIDKTQDNGQQNLDQDLENVKKFHLQTNDQQLAIMLQNSWKEHEVKNKSQQISQVNFEQQQLFKDLKHLYELVTKMVLQKHICLQQQQPNQYLFVVEQKSIKKVKYLAVGPLNTTKLNFFRIRFKNELSLNLNVHGDQSLFYHPTNAGYYKFQYENARPGGQESLYKCEQITCELNVSFTKQ